MQTALAEPYIVQERVALPSEPYPELRGRHACSSSTGCSTPHPFVCHGDVHGRLPDADLDGGAAERDGRRRLDGADVSSIENAND